MKAVLDSHVHIIGNGSSGSGCQLNLKKIGRRSFMRFQAKRLGLPKNAFKLDLDTLFVQRLVSFMETSNLNGSVILANDFPRDEKGEPIDNRWLFYVPNDYVIQLGKAYGYFIPAVSIHPARPDAIDELARCVKEGAMMVKLLPNYHNVDCRRAEYKRFWRALAELKVPLLAHTGGESILYNHAPDLRSPVHLQGALDEGATVIAAHAATKSALFDKSYLEEFEEMVRNYPNLYLDNSAFNLPTRAKHYADILKAPFLKRMIHGSDFPVAQSAVWPLIRGYLNWQDFKLAFRKRKNPIEMDFLVKRAIGVPKEPFTRLSTILSEQAMWPERAARLRDPGWTF